MIAKVAETLKNAKKAEELDDLLLSISKSQIPEYGNNPQLQSSSRELQGAMQIVDNWQEYLIAEETGNYQARRNQLEQISSQLARTPIIPRSIVLRLLNQSVSKTPEANVTKPDSKRVSIDSIQERLTESGDVAAALADIKAIPEDSPARSTDKTFEQSVMTVEALRTLEPSMSESEVFANIRNINNSISQRRFAFNRAIDQIALNAISRSYGMQTPSAKTTSARNVLESIATDAAVKNDWSKLRKAINSLDSLGNASNNTDSSKRINDLKMLSLLELGEAAEKRNDPEAAANAYIEASLIDGHYLQREVAYSKLMNLKEKSPEKVGDVMAKAAQIRERAEAARNSMMLDVRERMMDRRMPNERSQREDLTALRPVIEQVVAEFLKSKRLEAPNSAEKVEAVEEPKELKKPQR